MTYVPIDLNDVELVKVEDLKEGDKVDLEFCPYLNCRI